ncbi:MAG: 3,4-dihydroxy-2-butanone-4-phosphate synthase [Phycisphaerales bacterium]|nr:3,4-dihydroxy-2-butanone-4-phosphate synthase [Phycisphaerales bacterium]
MHAEIPEILNDLRAGKMIILTDDEDRENEGDMVLPAQFATAEAITFMLSVARGYMCLSLTESDCDRLDLEPQAAVNTSARGTPFTVSIDGHPKHGFTTGVSAPERARCIQMAIDDTYAVDDFVRPGHINPLRSRDGGVLVRTGQTEGSVDLCRLAGLYPAAVIIETMRDDGEMARLPDLEHLARQHDLKITSVAKIIEYRLKHDPIVKRLDPVNGTMIRTPEGEFRLFAFESVVDALPHVVLTTGDVGVMDGAAVLEQTEPTLVRMHRRNLLGDIFGERSEDGTSTAAQLRASMRAIQEEGRGAVVYLRQEVAEDDLARRLISIRRPGADDPRDPAIAPMEQRDVGVGCQILRQLGISRLRLLTNAPKHRSLDAFGLEVVEHVPIEV